jgi:gamma-glutamylcyclotransferase (GGCT)/AIG2-like uncharacterized protein YtfP
MQWSWIHRSGIYIVGVMHVFTYGTLMFPEVWQAVVGRSYESVEGIASGYQIFRVRDAVFPGITAGPATCAVRGIVYLDVDAPSIERLDRFEDSFYERTLLSVECDDGRRLDADAYVVPIANRDVLTTESWDPAAFVDSGGLRHFVSRFQGFARLAGDN